MADESLIAKVNNPEIFYNLMNLVGTTFQNNGEEILTITEGLLKPGETYYYQGYRFNSRLNIEDRTEVELVCQPMDINGNVLKIIAINIYGSAAR